MQTKRNKPITQRIFVCLLSAVTAASLVPAPALAEALEEVATPQGATQQEEAVDTQQLADPAPAAALEQPADPTEEQPADHTEEQLDEESPAGSAAPVVATTQSIVVAQDSSTYNISSGPVIITESNADDWDGRTITGTLSALCTSNAFSEVNSDSQNQRAAIVIDGANVNLTIKDLNITATTTDEARAMVSPILLVNEATLNLTLDGSNALTASYGGAGICVPDGCSLTINGTGDNSSLSATGGDSGPYRVDGYTGGAGIGGAAKSKDGVRPGTGSITITGGTITACGGSEKYDYGAAGIGGPATGFCGLITISGGTVNATGGSWAAGIGSGGSSSSNQSLDGSITISGGTVNATGGNSAAAIGGGIYNSVSEINISAGEVTATSAGNGCAIGSGLALIVWSLGHSVEVPSVIISGGNVTANGNIGHPAQGSYTGDNNDNRVELDLVNATIECTGEITYDQYAKQSFNVTIYDQSLTTGSYDCTFEVDGGGRAETATLEVSSPGVGTVNVTKIVDYGDAAQRSVTARIQVGDKTYTTEPETIERGTASHQLHSGYSCSFSGWALDEHIVAGQEYTVSFEGVGQVSSGTTQTIGRLDVSGSFIFPEGTTYDGTIISDDAPFTTQVTVNVDGEELKTNVTFNKSETHTKTGSFSIVPSGAVSYIDDSGIEQSQETWTRLNNSMTTLTSGWYYLMPSDVVTQSERITVSGNVNLILGSGATLNAKQGIGVSTGNSLTIYEQPGGAGTINAIGRGGDAGIGGTFRSGFYEANYIEGSAGAITICGGVVHAEAYGKTDGGAGIGGAFCSPRSGGAVRITGGIVSATTEINNGDSIGAATIQPRDLATIVLDWNSWSAPSMEIYNQILHTDLFDKGTQVTFAKPFVLKNADGTATNTLATRENISDKTIVPATKIEFDGNGGSGSMDAAGCADGGSYELPNCAFTAPAGKQFKGWKVGDYENLYNPEATVANIPLSAEPLTVKAVWGDAYAVTVTDSAKEYITVSPTPNFAGDVVTITLDYPEYLDLVPGSLKATYGEGTVLALNQDQDSPLKYTFAMPESDVTVTGKFRYNRAAVPYVNAAGNKGEHSPVSDYFAVTANDGTWGTENQNTWYVVNEDTVLSGRVTVTGNVNLILCDNMTLTANAGINVSEGASLTIWAQSLGSAKGRLEAKSGNPYCAAIGGNKEHANAGSITINGGSVTATAASGEYAIGAAIGGGGAESGGTGGNGGTITINGGDVTAKVDAATTNFYGAAIGGGGAQGENAGGNGGTITINGGNVTAKVDEATGSFGAAIGGGFNGSGGTIKINGGNVTAQAHYAGQAAAIGGGDNGSSGSITISDGEVTATADGYGAAIGGGNFGSSNKNSDAIVINGGTVIATNGSATNSDSNHFVSAAAIGGGSNDAVRAISINGGTVNATVYGSSSTAAAIGSGGYCPSDKPTAITIVRGNVTATAFGAGACIGSGAEHSDKCTILINGGTVEATKPDGQGACIGGGSSLAICNSINISGGVVTAIHKGSAGAAIGYGDGGTSNNNRDSCDLNINGGMVTAELRAARSEKTAAIGKGGGNGYVPVTVSGGTVVAKGNGNSNCYGFGNPDSGLDDGGAVAFTYDTDKRNICVYSDSYGIDVLLLKDFKDRDTSTVFPKTTITALSAAEASGKTLVAAESWKVTVADGITGGSVVPSATSIGAGKEVTLTVVADKGCMLKPGSLKAIYYEGGQAIEIAPTQDPNGPSLYAYVFNTPTPGADVTVTAKFDQHQHDFTYSAQDNTITAICTNINSESPCDLPDHKATLTIEAPTGDLVYDGSEKPATVTGDTDVLGTPTITYTKDGETYDGTPRDAGAYVASITLGEATASVSYTIAPRPVSVGGLCAVDVTYDGTTVAEYTYSETPIGVLDVDVDKVFILPGLASFSDPNVGNNKTVTFSGFSLTGDAASNYVLSAQPEPMKASITKRLITIKANDQSIVFGDSIDGGAGQVSVIAPPAEGGLMSLVGGHRIASVVLVAPYTTVTTEGTITPTSVTILDKLGMVVTNNYDLHFQTGVLTVNPAMAKVTTDPVAVEQITYNGKPQPLVTDDGQASTGMEYAVGNADAAPTEGWTEDIPTGTNAGNYMVWYRAKADDNHNASEAKSIAVSIQKSDLTVRAKDASITYGDPKPAIDPSTDVTYDGFVNNETAAVLGGELALTCDYVQYGNAGKYAITPSGLTSNNYDIYFASGKLSVKHKSVGITWDNKGEFTYNGSPQAPTATVTAGDLVNDDEVSVIVGGAQTDAGTDYVATAAGLSGTKASSYKLDKNASKTKNYSIAKAEHANESAEGSAVYGTAGSVELAALIADGGRLSVANVSDAGGVLSDAPAVLGTKLSFGFKNVASNAGKLATASLRVTDARNYQDYDVVVTLRVIDKSPIHPTVSIKGWTYGQRANAPTVSGNPGDGRVDYAYKLEGASDASYASRVPTEPGNYVVRATVAETAAYHGGAAYARFTIGRATADVIYAAHCQGTGWDAPAGKNGGVAGTTGEARRLEALAVWVAGGSIEYRSHVQGTGWEKTWVADGAVSGTTGQAKRIEAIQMRLKGALASQGMHVWYRAHVQGYGWLGWAKDGDPAGTSGQAKRLEAYEVVVLGPGQVPDGYNASRPSYIGAAQANVHLQRTGWQGTRTALTFGTTGQARRLEAMSLATAGLPWAGGVEYELHLQRTGWQGWRANGAVAGTTGEARRAEAVKVQLTDDLAEHMSVWYRVHSQTYGWLGWAHDGQIAGTTGLSKRAEAVEVQILPKGSVPIGYNSKPAYRS